MELLTQKEMFDAVSAKFPDLLTKPVHRLMRLASPLHTMQLQEKIDLFKSALQDMLAEISNGKNATEVAYDTERSRLWSLGLQPMWEVSPDEQQSKLLGTESLVALHGSSWAVGLILDVLDHLFNTDLERPKSQILDPRSSILDPPTSRRRRRRRRRRSSSSWRFGQPRRLSRSTRPCPPSA